MFGDDCKHIKENPWGNECYLCSLEEQIDNQQLLLIELEERIIALEKKK